MGEENSSVIVANKTLCNKNISVPATAHTAVLVFDLSLFSPTHALSATCFVLFLFPVLDLVTCHCVFCLRQYGSGLASCIKIYCTYSTYGLFECRVVIPSDTVTLSFAPFGAGIMSTKTKHQGLCNLSARQDKQIKSTDPRPDSETVTVGEEDVQRFIASQKDMKPK